MNRLLTWIEALGDRMNPVAVKEFRQAVQSRWVITILMIFLLVNLAIIGGSVMLSISPETSTDLGREVFSALLIVLLFTCMWFVPLYSGIRLTMERNDANIDLLFISTITPGSIVRGKFLAAMGLTLLIFSTCMPFMVLTYLLRGVDLPTIFFAMALGFMVCALANAMGIFAGCVSGSAIIRGIVDVGVLLGLFFLAISTVSMLHSAMFYGGLMFVSGGSMWRTLGVYLICEALAIGLLYVLSEAMVSPKTSNRMLIPRLYITGCWMATGVAMVLWSVVETSRGPIEVWTALSGGLFIALIVASLGERDTWSARMRRTIPRNRLLRSLAFLFYTGSAGGIIWSTLLFVATMAVGVAVMGLTLPGGTGSGFTETVADLAMTFGYILCYCLTVAALRPWVLRNVATPNLSVFAAFLGMFLCLAPYLVAFFLEDKWWPVPPWYTFFSPMVLAMNNTITKDAVGPLLIAWLVPVSLASVPWALGQWRQFVPREVMTIPESEAALDGGQSPFGLSENGMGA